MAAAASERVQARMRMTAADTLQRLPPARRQRWALARAAAEHLRPAIVLDAGCGDGLFTLDLAEANPQTTFLGVDLSERALQRAEQERRRRGLDNVSFACVDLTRLALRQQVDLVLALECLVEIPDDDAALACLARATRPGGTVLLHLPEASWRPVLRTSEQRWRHEARHGYSVGRLPAWLAGAGLRLRSVRPTQRNVVTVAQELRDRYKRARPAALLALAPLAAAAARLDTMGLTWGPARGLFVVAEPTPGGAADATGAG